MLKTIRLILMLCVVAFFANTSYAVTLTAQTQEFNLNHEIAYWAAPSGSVTIDDLRSERIADEFKVLHANDSVLNLGFKDADVWVRFVLDRTEDAHSRWFLEIPYLGIDQIDLYTPDGVFFANGSLIPPAHRPVFSRFYAFPLQADTTPHTYYLRVKSAYPITLPIRIMDQQRFHIIQDRENLIQFLYFGGLLSLLIYNLFLYLSLGDRKYLIYCLFSFFSGLAIFAGNGYGFIYLWPNAPHWNTIAQSTLFGIAAFLGIQFTTETLRTYRFFPTTHRILQTLSALYLAIVIGLALSLKINLPTERLYQGLFLLGLTTPLVVIGVCIRNIRHKIKSAYYFLAAWGFMCIGAFTSAARSFDILPSNGMTLYAFQIGSGFELVLFSLALAYRVRQEREKREQAQADVVRALQISEERLEKAVDAQTQKLQHLLLSEQQMRSQYTRFCALIAHEFRNPLNIIQAQAAILSRDPHPTVDVNQKRTDVIRSAIERLVGLFETWLENDRINMAMDQMQLEHIELNALLHDIVTECVTYHSGHHIRAYAATDPVTIQGDRHLLEIAIFNLIDNASKYSPENSAISISLIFQGDECGIRISDEGIGIPEDKIRQIFEPYIRATHHGAPDGLGLGLAFVKRITEQHEGHLEIHSAQGQGTAVTLWLPTLKARVRRP